MTALAFFPPMAVADDAICVGTVFDCPNGCEVESGDVGVLCQMSGLGGSSLQFCGLFVQDINYFGCACVFDGSGGGFCSPSTGPDCVATVGVTSDAMFPACF